MRSGTRSASEKFQTSCCRATQARISSSSWHLRMAIESALTRHPAPVPSPLATKIPVLPSRRLEETAQPLASAPPSTETGAGTYDWFSSERTQNQGKDNAQCLPAQRKDRQ